MYYPSSENKGADQLPVTAKLICAFVFAYADCWLSHGAAQIYYFLLNQTNYRAVCAPGPLTVVDIYVE